MQGAPICCEGEWRLAVMPLSCCGFLVDWEGVGLEAAIHLLLLPGLVGSFGELVGPVGGSVGRQVVMLSLRMRLWWDVAVLRGLGVTGEELGLLLLGRQPRELFLPQLVGLLTL